MVWRRIVCAGVLASLAAPAFAIGEFSAGGWQGRAFFKDAQFTHCGMRAKEGPWELLFALNRAGTLSLGLHHKQLKFTKGNQLQGSMQVNDGPPLVLKFASKREKLIESPLARLHREQLDHAGRLRLKVGDVSADIPLGAAREALKLLEACAQRRGG